MALPAGESGKTAWKVGEKIMLNGVGPQFMALERIEADGGQVWTFHSHSASGVMGRKATDATTAHDTHLTNLATIGTI